MQRRGGGMRYEAKYGRARVFLVCERAAKRVDEEHVLPSGADLSCRACRRRRKGEKTAGYEDVKSDATRELA